MSLKNQYGENGKDIAAILCLIWVQAGFLRKIPDRIYHQKAIIQTDINSKIHTFDANPIVTEFNPLMVSQAIFA
ncbi:hypothetical protein [Flavitalea sp.]|nr:hypothetical protein [Flavitalea sp.]